MKSEVKPIEVSDIKKLPEMYIVFQDDLDEVMKVIKEKEERLLKRGLLIKHPYEVYRFTDNTFVNRKKPCTQIIFKLEKING